MEKQTNKVGFYYKENDNQYGHDVHLEFSIYPDAHLGEIFNMCKKFAIALGYADASVEEVFGPDNEDW